MRPETTNRILLTVLLVPVVGLSLFFIASELPLWGILTLIASVGALIWIWIPKQQKTKIES